MCKKNKYLLDSNILITAHRQTYPFDLAPGFWEQLISKGAKNIIIIESVSNEILKGDDDLTEWFDNNKHNFELMSIPDEAIISAYTTIINKINNSTKYTQTAKREFAGVADSWLCAYGYAYEYTVVTNEKFNNNSRKRIIIPNICYDFKIKCIGVLDFMRKLEFELR